MLTDIGLMHILELSTLGYSVLEMARYLRVSKEWLEKRLNPEHESFDERAYIAHTEGAHEFTKRIRKSQIELGDVNATMAIHLGKQYLGQRDKQEIEVTKTVHIVGTMPDYEQTPEEWRKQFGPQSAAPRIEPSRRIDVEEAEVVDEAG